MKIVKGLPFLAMGGLTLGLVGATVLAPVVSAVDPATFNQKVTATVNGGTTLNLIDPENAADNSAVTNLNLGSLNPSGIVESKVFKVQAASNEGGFKVTVANVDTSTSLREINDQGAQVDGGASIPASADVQKGTSAWGIKFSEGDTLAGDAAYQAVPASDATGLTLFSADSNDLKTASVKVGVSTSDRQQARNYRDTITYTLTGETQQP